MKIIKDTHAVIDLSIVLMIVMVFAALLVVGYIMFQLKVNLINAGAGTAAQNSMNNVTEGFDNAVTLILVAITIFILAIAISALLMLRGRQD